MDERDFQRAREEIARVDREMAGLFVRRMEAVGDIAAYKREKGLAVLDAAQERAVLERNLDAIEDAALRPFYQDFLRGLMEVSKAYQRRLMEEEEA